MLILSNWPIAIIFLGIDAFTIGRLPYQSIHIHQNSHRQIRPFRRQQCQYAKQNNVNEENRGDKNRKDAPFLLRKKEGKALSQVATTKTIDSETTQKSMSKWWLNEDLYFKCTGCGKCCTTEGEVWLDIDEFVEIAMSMSITLEEFLDRYAGSNHTPIHSMNDY